MELLGLRASEFLRMVAMTKAYSWSQPTTAAMQNNLERKRLGLKTMAGKFQAELKVDVSQAITGVEKLDKKIDGVVEKQKTLRDLKATANVDVDVNDSDVAELKKDIAAVDGKNVDVNVNVKQPSGGLTAFTAGIGAAVGGAALTGVTALAEGLLEGAQAADAFGDTLSIAFTQQGIADVEGEIESVKQSTLSLAQELGLPIARVRELGQAVATIGGLSGEQAEGLTKLSVSIETFTDGTVKGEAIVKAFSRGIADPEGAAAIDALSKKYPQLSDTLRSTASASEKLAEANKILGPSFAAAVAGANDVGGVIQRVKNTVSEGFENVGTKIATAILPAITFLLDNAELLLPIVIGLAAGLVVYAAGAAAAAISTALASVAGLTFNAVLAANPIGAVIVAVIALTAGVMLLADALEETAEEQLAVTETQIAATKSQIEDNEAKKKGVISTQAMVKEYKELANKTALTAKEQERMRGIQNELDKQYPDLIDQTKSFRDNLDGVEAAGKAVTTSMEGLTKEGIKLGEQLKEQTKLLAFVKRNAEIQKLENVFGFFDGKGIDAQRTAAVGLAKKAIEKFKSEILASQNESQVLDAQRAINEVLNKNAGQLADEYEELTLSVQSSISAQIAAINLAKGIKPIVVTEVKPEPKPEPKPRPKDDKADKSALEIQQKKLQIAIADRAQQLLNLQAKNAELVTLDKLTAKEAKFAEAVLRTKLAEENRLQAIDLLKAKLDEEGIVIGTSIKLAEGESLQTIKDTLQNLSNALRTDEQNVLQLRTDIAREELGKQVADALLFANALAEAKFFNFDESTLKRFIDKGIDGVDGFSDFVAKRVAELDAQIKILGELAAQQNETERTKSLADVTKLETAKHAILQKAALAEIEVRKGVAKKLEEENVLGTALVKTLASFEIVVDNDAANKALEETKELIAGVNEEFASGELTYQQAMEKLKDVSKEQSGFMEALASAVAESGETLSKSLATSAKEGRDAGKSVGDTTALVAASVGASFISMAASGENVWVALAKAAFAGLQAMVPIWSALIVGGSLATPQSIITAGGAGLAQWAALTAIIQSFVTAARAAAGFKDGGPTGDNIGSNQVAGVVHGKEFVAPERMYAKHGDLLKHLYANRELSSFPEIQSLMKQNQIIPMRDLALNMGGGSQSITVNAMAGDALKPLQDELQGVRRQLVAMEALHKSSSDITVTADEGYHARRARRSAIKGARN